MHLLAGVADHAHGHDHAHGADSARTAGDVFFLSAADSELSLMASARRELLPLQPPESFRLRLANPLQMTDAASSRRFADLAASEARLVVLRLLGGRGYWTHGVDALVSACAARGVPLALLPGDERDDEEMAALSTLAVAERAQFLAYCNQGGAENYRNFLLYAAAHIGRAAEWQPPRPVLAAAPYLPGRGAVSLAEVRAGWREGGAVAVILFYRAFYLSGETAPIDALVRALERVGINPLAIFVQSLRDAASRRILDDLALSPDLIVNTTGFALVRPGDERLGDSDGDGAARIFAGAAPEFQVALAGISRAEWLSSSAGLPPRELAMNVALPEVDGRVFTAAVSFKEEAGFDSLVECEVMRRVAEEERVAHFARLARGWSRLARLKEDERRVGFVVANYPSRDGRLANGVGLDTPESLARVFRELRAAGDALGDNLPEDGAALMSRLLGLASAADPSREAEIVLSRDDYEAAWRGLPDELREAVTARWGVPEDDPFFRDDAFAVSGFRLGEVFVGIQPSRGYHLDPAATYHDPALVPPHGYLAFYFWLRAGVDVVVQFGKHGNLEWLPGKSVALSRCCWPDALLGGVPLLYPFIVNDPGEGTQAKRRSGAVILDHLTPPLGRAELYGSLSLLESLMDEYYEAAMLDPRRAEGLRGDILGVASDAGLDRDIGLINGSGDGDGAAGLDALALLDNHLCELKEMQIRAGLHIYGELPGASERSELLVSLLRCPRGGDGGDVSLLRALSDDMGLGFDPLNPSVDGDNDGDGEGGNDGAADGRLINDNDGDGGRPAVKSPINDNDGAGNRPPVKSPINGDDGDGGRPAVKSPINDSDSDSDGNRPSVKSPIDSDDGDGGRLAVKSPINGSDSDGGGRPPVKSPINGNAAAPLAADYTGARPEILREQSDKPWRSVGDTVERLELLSLALVEGRAAPPENWTATRKVMEFMREQLVPAFEKCGDSERDALLKGLAGQFVAPGPSGAPSRGRPEVLPTGRNFYSLDPRAVPTPSAWNLGWNSARQLVHRHRRDHGHWPRHLALSAWGTANLRTGGDDIAQALALIGVQPEWDAASRRVTGIKVLPVSVLGRPRVDLTLRISGFFRDAFPAQMKLIDDAVRAVAALDEPPDDNPLAQNVADTAARLQSEGLDETRARARASRRIFGSAPGAYGAGLQALIDSGAWHEENDLAQAWLGWSAFAYGASDYGAPAADELTSALSRVEAVVHNQDNREHDLLDSDDYYQFEGGLTAAVRALSGADPVTYHNDHSRPWSPRVRTLGEEIGRVVRARAANPKWINAMMRHGYKGGFEMAATVDYLFAFAATTTAVQAHHFDALYDAYIEDDAVRGFLADANPAALAEMAARFIEAQERALWQNRSNHVRARLEALAARDTK